MRQILCFGDSNTWGLDGDSGKRLPWGVRWTSLLQEKLGQQYHVIEEGLCGRTTIFDDPLRDGRRGTELLPILLETHATVDGVVLMLGTNDCKTAFGASAEVIGRGIQCLLDQIQTFAPQTDVLLISAGGNPANFSDLSGRQCLETGIRSGIFASIYCCFTASAVGL